MIRILLCDDQAITRDGLAMLLALEADMEIVGSARDGAEAVAMAIRLRPDIVLMDLKMPGMNGIEATRQICQHLPRTKILILTTYNDDPWVIEAIRAGASGYLLKDAPREELLGAVRGTIAGKTYIDAGVAGALLKQLVQPPPPALLNERLSAREYAILQRIVAGMSNSQIADDLQLSDGTVRNYVSAILTKLEVADRTQAAVLAIQHGLTPPR
ncbi:MAG TPA: response regulator transcription factor [Herpetosiphonaceae bacterium]|nr:response regulator transcription factor [Herpetosiphonaceae bacterium]